MGLKDLQFSKSVINKFLIRFGYFLKFKLIYLWGKEEKGEINGEINKIIL